MLRRKMSEVLSGWKAAKNRKALILLGARQTGKTFVVREFARSEYSSYVEVNFVDDEENGAFLAGASSADDLVSRLSIVAGRPIGEGELLFFDEVQHLGRNIVTLAKFLVEDGRFDLVLSGSLLGTTLEGVASFPVGYVHIERMYPLDFEEFCWAMGVPEGIVEQLAECYREKVPVESSLHDRMTRLFRYYLAVGGMPEAVQGFLNSGRMLGVARGIDEDIVEQYRFDITKYVSTRKLQVRAIFDSLPSQLAKENKRFMMKAVKEGATHERLKDDFAWLEDAGVVLATYHVTEPKYPLSRTKTSEKFKLYSSDCGVLLAQYPQGAAMQISQGAGDANFGAVYENVVAQEIKAAGFPLYYYHHSRKGEVDFLLETADGKVLPVEVKSGKDYKLHTALNNLLGTPDYGIEEAYVLSENNVSRGEREGKPVYYLPLYFTMFLKEERKAEALDVALEPIEFD